MINRALRIFKGQAGALLSKLETSISTLEQIKKEHKEYAIKVKTKAIQIRDTADKLVAGPSKNQVLELAYKLDKRAETAKAKYGVIEGKVAELQSRKMVVELQKDCFGFNSPADTLVNIEREIEKLEAEVKGYMFMEDEV